MAAISGSRVILRGADMFYRVHDAEDCAVRNERGLWVGGALR